SDNPVIAERAMYWNSNAGIFRQAAHDSIGVTESAANWYLAEGSTGINEQGAFETWILVQNTGVNPAEADIFFQTPAGEIQGPHLTLAPHTRQTVNVAETVPNEFSVSTRVTSDNPVIAERAMYWNAATGVYRQAAHDSIGASIAGTSWFLAEGSTGINQQGAFETWVLVQNPWDEPAEVDLFYQTPTGEIPGPHIVLAPYTRQSINVADTAGVSNEFSVSTRVSASVPVIAERAMYWNAATGVYRQAAHDSIGLDP
ncbi:MAG: hypothetical protein JW738_03520, partial [Actinobacteria bacterium]|nr:hypothetical protein [Actinomycetota bacterium]